MPTPAELEAKFWKALEADRTVMLGLDGIEDAHPRPMTAQFEDNRAPIWFSPRRIPRLSRRLPRPIAPSPPSPRAVMTSSRRCTACSSLEQNRAMVDKFWNLPRRRLVRGR